MHTGLSLAITQQISETVVGGGGPVPIFDTLGARAGFAIDFVRGQMRINDPVTPANNFIGVPEAKLTVFGSDPYLYDPTKGIVLDPARDFSIALATGLFPYEPTACTVYIKYHVNAATSTEQRYLVMADNAGNDRFALYAVGGGAFRFVTGDGSSADIALSNRFPVADQPEEVLFGADAGGKTFVDTGGVHNNTGDILAASTPAHLGIGGYNNQVLRVLDGHIAEIMVVCEPVPVADRLSLDLSGWVSGNSGNAPVPPAFDILGPRNGFAVDFIAKRMKINDDITPANVFDGDPEAKLTVFGTDPFAYDPAKGLVIDAARDFSIGLDTSIIPYNPMACTVYAKYRLNAAASADQRYLFMADNAGNDRFSLYSVSGPMRFVTGDGATANIAVSAMTLAGDTEYRVTFGCDADGKTYVDDGGIQDNSTVTLSASTPATVGIGGYNDRVLRVLDGHLAEIVVVYEPMLREARLTVDAFSTVYKAEGDSHTFNTSFGLNSSDFYPALVASQIGNGCVSANFGWSGDSSAEMVNQLPAFSSDSRPDIATIYAGANDGPVTILATPAPTTTTFTVDVSSRLAVDGWVIINGQSVQITGKTGDDITVSPVLAAAPTASDLVDIDTQKNIEVWIDAITALGVSKIMVIGYHYMNWASGGDTTTTEHPTRATLRAKQRAAATAKSVPYCDTFAHMRAAVIAGDVGAGDDLSWHVAIGNTHLNVAGEQAVANAVYDAFVAEGWHL